MNFLCLCVSYTTIIPLYAWLSFCVAPTFFHNTAHNKGSPNGFQKNCLLEKSYRQTHGRTNTHISLQCNYITLGAGGPTMS